MAGGERGRAPGAPKTGGRKAGTPNKRTAYRKEAEEARKAGKTPLAFLCEVFRNPKRSMPERIDAAKAAAAYMHPKLTAVNVSNADDGEQASMFATLLQEIAGERKVGPLDADERAALVADLEAE